MYSKKEIPHMKDNEKRLNILKIAQYPGRLKSEQGAPLSKGVSHELDLPRCPSSGLGVQASSKGTRGEQLGR